LTFPACLKLPPDEAVGDDQLSGYTQKMETMAEHYKPEDCILRVLASSEAGDLARDFAELGVDAFLKEGVLRDVPLVGTLVGLVKAGLTVRDYLFVRKLVRFLREAETVPVAERQEFVKGLHDRGLNERVGTVLLDLIDRYDDDEKIPLLGKLFAAYVDGEIDHDEFIRFSRAIERAFYGDLKAALNVFEGQRQGDSDLWERLLASGLSRPKLGVKIDSGMGVNIVVSESPTMDRMLRYTYNPDAVRLAMVLLGRFFGKQYALRGYSFNAISGRWQCSSPRSTRS
jgi:hypothetical protein